MASAPVHFDAAEVDWTGMSSLLNYRLTSPPEVVAISWCSFLAGDSAELSGEPVLAMILRYGVLTSAGQRERFGDGLAFNEINFTDCRRIVSTEVTGKRGPVKFCIEFLDADGTLRAKLLWSWRLCRFRDSRSRIAAVASESDRIMKVVRALAA